MITFKDLSLNLKIAIIGAYILTILSLISFVVGFIQAILLSI